MTSALSAYLWPPYGIGQAIIFSSCGFFLSSLFFFSSPNLSGRRADVYHTSTRGVAFVRIYNAGLKCTARCSLEIQNPKMTQKIAICAPSHNFSGYIFPTEAHIDNRKKFVKQQYRLQMSSQYGELRPTSS